MHVWCGMHDTSNGHLAGSKVVACWIAWLLSTSAMMCAVSAWSFPEQLAADVAHHLQINSQHLLQPVSSPWGTVLNIKRELQGQGFHRTLHLVLQINQTADSQLQGCSLALLQHLPSSVFVDPYQLEDLLRLSATSYNIPEPRYAYSFKLFGPLDLELPAPACQPTALLLSVNVTYASNTESSTNSSTALAGAALSVPLHAKYPEPQPAGFQGLQAVMTGQATIELPWPALIVDCRPAGGELKVMPPPHRQQQQQCYSAADVPCSACTSGGSSTRSSTCSSSGSGSSSSGSGGVHEQCCADEELLLWRVPAGNLDHQKVVSWGTLLVTATCAAVLIYRSIAVAMFGPDGGRNRHTAGTEGAPGNKCC